MFALWFRAFKCFRIWLQTYIQNVAQIIFYYHVKKQYLSCLNWIITYFLFQNMFWKNISCFWFWWKTYTKRCTNSNVISHVTTISSPALCDWLISGCNVENGEYCISKNIELKIWSQKFRFLFCPAFVYFAYLSCECRFF